MIQILAKQEVTSWLNSVLGRRLVEFLIWVEQLRAGCLIFALGSYYPLSIRLKFVASLKFCIMFRFFWTSVLQTVVVVVSISEPFFSFQRRLGMWHTIYKLQLYLTIFLVKKIQLSKMFRSLAMWVSCDSRVHLKTGFCWWHFHVLSFKICDSHV